MSATLKHIVDITLLWGVLPSAKRPEGRAVRGRPGNALPDFVWPAAAKRAALLSLHNPVARAARALAGRYTGVASRQGARSASHRVMQG